MPGSFLRDRTRVHNAWEATKGNEPLTRMEAFEGLFVCSTNLMDDLDPAALRRFDLKVRFVYLRPEQAWKLFRSVLNEQGVRVPRKADWLPRLARLERLTPGDFLTLVRRQRLALGRMAAASLFASLRGESAFKSGREGRGIGFAAEL
jgi:hypothetical protein